MDKKYTWTVDAEFDWGGRTNGTLGIRYGLPKIIELFDRYKVRGLFFISTELLSDSRTEIKRITEHGHEIGSHGHFHIQYRDPNRAQKDMELSKTLILGLTGKSACHYRAPKFSFDNGDRFANPKNHVGLLKSMWLGANMPKMPIFYLHPFDIIDWHGDVPPNLFCQLWYSRPRGAFRYLCELLSRYQ